MLPYLLPIVLIMYGEFSRDIHTRFISRVIFYSYVSTYFLAGQLPLDSNQELLFNSGILSLSLGYVVVRCRGVISSVPFAIASLGIMVNAVSLYLGDFRIIELLPFYANNSHYIIRECILFGVGAFSLWKRNKLERDYKLTAILFWMWCVESIII